MAPEPLDSAETRRLLDTISSLDDLCVLFVNSPQIIVVGDQGSGKSSVLEAISRVHFPVGDGVCTRFPIELVLRRAPQESTYLEVLFDTRSLDVGGRSFSRTTRTREPFSHSGFARNELPAMIARAKQHMGLEDDRATGYSRDILLVGIEGPDVPTVTLVDLPGVFHPDVSTQLQNWKPVVDDLVDSYMRRPNSIILTVLSANVPLAAHAVLNRAARFDPDGGRTIGVITKPDLCPSTNIEAQYIRLVKGQEPDHHLPLGWHVLRNRGSKEPAVDYDERDAQEDDFLAEGTRKWWRLPASKIGVDALRKKLADTLLWHIKGKLPDLIAEVESEIQTRQVRLQKIGAARASHNEMREYLLGISAAFHRLAEHAVEGRYNDPFFASPTVQETSRIRFRKLRALLRNLNRAFDLTMKRKGARYKIEWEQEQQDEANGNVVSIQEQLANFMAEAEAPANIQPYLELYDFPDPTLKSEAMVNARIERIASGSQGVEFPGLPNSDLIMQLFRDLSEPWPRIAQRHIDIVVERTRLFVYHLFDYILEDDTKTRDAILSEYVDPAFEAITDTLKSKLAEILRPYSSGHGIPLDLEFRAGFSRRKLARIAGQIAGLLEQNENSVTYNTTAYWLLRHEEVRNIVMDAHGMTVGSDFGTDVVIDMMLTHYEASLKTFTDNVTNLVIENCLVSSLPDIFSTKIVTQMDDAMLEKMAEEPRKVKAERIALEEEIMVLKLGLQECQRSRPRNFSEPADTFPELTFPIRSTREAEPEPVNLSPPPSKAARKPRVRLPPFTEYAKATSSLESPFGQIASTGAAFASLLQQGPDISSKGKAPVFAAASGSTSTTATAAGSTAATAGSTTAASSTASTTSSTATAGTTKPGYFSFGSGAATTSQAPLKPRFVFGSGAATTAASAAKPSVFGTIAATTSGAPDTKSTSLFGEAATTSKALSSDVATTTTTAPKTESLFGSGATTTASAPKTASIFGSDAATTSAAPKTGSLFGSGAATTSQDPDAKPRSLFSTIASRQSTSESSTSVPSETPSTDGLIGSPAAPAPQPSVAGTVKSSVSSAVSS
ncbi:P-loop containing nucleoside triphosphate hydrolase protein [Trichoderma austrokoningii]